MSSRATLLAVLGFLSFSSVYTNVVVSPVLVEVARDFGITTGTAGLLVAAFGLPGIIVGLFAGPFSDRYGRKPFLVSGTAVMAVFTVLGGLAWNFPVLLLSRVLAGFGASVIFPNVNASVGDEFPYRERGRAMSTIIGTNTLATIVGVPFAGVIADAVSWRASLAIVGVLGLVAVAALVRLLRDSPRPAGENRVRELYAQILSDSSARASIASSLLGAMFWFTWVTYLVAFFQTSFALAASVASFVALTSGLGVLAGSQIGGRLGDRIGQKAIVGWSITLSGLVLLVETNVLAGVAFAAAMNLLLATASGARFAANSTLVSEQAPGARGTMFAVNSSIVSLGIVAGSTAGGVLVDGFGFGAVGVLAAAAAFTSGLVVWRFVREPFAQPPAGEAIE